MPPDREGADSVSGLDEPVGESTHALTVFASSTASVLLDHARIPHVLDRALEDDPVEDKASLVTLQPTANIEFLG
jgi:hypothetical protein